MGLLQPHGRYRCGDGETALTKFIFKIEDSLWSAADQSEALKALEASLSKLKCLVCDADEFILNDTFLAPQVESLRSRTVYFSEENLFPLKARPILSMHCERCGFVMQFDETKVLDNAGLINRDSEPQKDNNG